METVAGSQHQSSEQQHDEPDVLENSVSAR